MTEPADLLKALGEPFPRTAIKSREGGGGRRFDYIETHTCIHRLNSVAGAWDFRIVSVDWRQDLLMVQGELTIPGLGTRTGFGVQKVAPNAGEDLVKGAASDALKKAATLFGVALELYGPDYASGEVSEAPRTSQRPDVRQQAEQGRQARRGGPTDKQANYIRRLAKDLSLTEERLNGYIEKEFGAPLDALPGAKVSELIDRMKAKVDERTEQAGFATPDEPVEDPDRWTR